MPELPEVETIRRQLEKKIKDKKITAVQVLQPRMINVPPEVFVRKVKGAKVKGARRRAKLLIINLSNGYSLVIHLKLTGTLLLSKHRFANSKANVIFEFSDRSMLLYKDIRKFGYMKLVETKNVEPLMEKEKFGPEPLTRDFTLEKFKKLLSIRKGSTIKPLLMDQTFLAGVGNIYAQEACFYARISPKRKAGDLTDKEIKNLYQGLRYVLAEATKHRGSSVEYYVDISGRKGGYVPYLKVYKRGGRSCLRCGARLKTIKLGGRGTAFCPQCQK